MGEQESHRKEEGDSVLKNCKKSFLGVMCEGWRVDVQGSGAKQGEEVGSVPKQHYLFWPRDVHLPHQPLWFSDMRVMTTQVDDTRRLLGSRRWAALEGQENEAVR